MLLRRITEHVRNQNWVAVGIDLLIVIVGVVIGIQVANWNDQRQLRISDGVLLERLKDDFTDIVATADLVEPKLREQSALTSHLIEALWSDKNLTLNQETESWLLAALDTWTSYPIPPS
ncbi:conserved hypothetical protein [Luminiphilus syltensis NOR5-1B]|uniref:Uncharacterized protein n=1 Tax=Luminiphilus syltensis NOR5-1B TaxID=565045 RepID=B8KSH0_9GAMM|nr:hypothetical protein [Luminiphilus syltensis]EED35988.1 conserved hypothetical protein [Luminiphilus syltensis NOR5-1B]